MFFTAPACERSLHQWDCLPQSVRLQYGVICIYCPSGLASVPIPDRDIAHLLVLLIVHYQPQPAVQQYNGQAMQAVHNV